MAFKLRATNGTNKQYLYPTADAAARGSRHWEYVTEDPPGTVDGSGYIDGATDDDHQRAVDMLSVGDLIWSFQVASADDDRSIEDDKVLGITVISLHAVLTNTGTVVNLSDDLLSSGLTYGD